MQQIIETYQAMTQRTLQEWLAHPAVGAMLSADPQRQQLGVSSGRLFVPTGALQQLHGELLTLAAQDSLFDVVPVHGLHFTFLALAWDHFAAVADLPEEIHALLPIFKETVAGLNFKLCDLRLVPLKNALLLAGVPDPITYTVRDRLVERVLQSSWRPWLEARYAGFPLPPLIWHTTLVRYGAAVAPQPLRALYHSYSGTSFGDLELGEPQIGVINYNWTIRILL